MLENSDRVQVIVNARFLTQPITGVQRFAIEICRRLKNLLPNIVFVSPKNILQKNIANELGVISFGRYTSHFWEQLELPLFLREKNKPLLLNLCNTAPLFYNKNIICIHDIAFAFNPKWFSPSFVALYKFLIPRIARKSLKVITVSEFSKKSIINYTSIPKEKIEIVYNGLSDVFLQPLSSQSKTNYQNYLLTVSSIDPRKNLLSLIKAFRKADLNNLDLLIVGSESKVFADEGLKEEIKSCPSIIFTGYLSDDALAACYKNAEIFIYPSLYEGFGIPPLEAMASGVPTIVSSAAALPEICGDASLYIDPLYVEDIKTKMELLTKNKVLRQELVQKGRKQVERYSWDKSAAKVACLLKQYL